jgi:MFS family permease
VAGLNLEGDMVSDNSNIAGGVLVTGLAYGFIMLMAGGMIFALIGMIVAIPIIIAIIAGLAWAIIQFSSHYGKVFVINLAIASSISCVAGIIVHLMLAAQERIPQNLEREDFFEELQYRIHGVTQSTYYKFEAIVIISLLIFIYVVYVLYDNDAFGDSGFLEQLHKIAAWITFYLATVSLLPLVVSAIHQSNIKNEFIDIVCLPLMLSFVHPRFGFALFFV